MAKAGVETQVKVRAGFVVKVQEKEKELEKKVKELGELAAERKVLEDKLATIEAERELEQAKMEEMKSIFVSKIALLEIQLKEAEASTPSFPLSSAPMVTMYALNTPTSKRRHGSHRRLHTSFHVGEEDEQVKEEPEQVIKEEGEVKEEPEQVIKEEG